MYKIANIFKDNSNKITVITQKQQNDIDDTHNNILQINMFIYNNLTRYRWA